MFSPSRPRENANAEAVSTDSMGTWMSRWTLLAYVIGKSDLSKNNQDPYKGEIKIPPPHPYQRKNINYFSILKGSIFSLPSRMTTWLTFSF